MKRLTPEETLELYKKHNLKPVSAYIDPNDGLGYCCGLGVKLVDVGFKFESGAYSAASELFGEDYVFGYWRGFDEAGGENITDDWLEKEYIKEFLSHFSDGFGQGFRDGFNSRRLVDKELGHTPTEIVMDSRYTSTESE